MIFVFLEAVDLLVSDFPYVCAGLFGHACAFRVGLVGFVVCCVLLLLPSGAILLVLLLVLGGFPFSVVPLLCFFYTMAWSLARCSFYSVAYPAFLAVGYAGRLRLSVQVLSGDWFGHALSWILIFQRGFVCTPSTFWCCIEAP